MKEKPNKFFVHLKHTPSGEELGVGFSGDYFNAKSQPENPPFLISATQPKFYGGGILLSGVASPTTNADNFEFMQQGEELHTIHIKTKEPSEVRIELLGDESDVKRGAEILSKLDCSKPSDVPEKSASDNKPAKHPVPEKGTLFYRRAFGRDCGHVQPKPFLQLCEWFQIILSPKTRQEVFEPLFNEIKNDHLVSLRDKSEGVRRWLMFKFVCKTLLMTVGCFLVMLRSKLARLLFSCIPESVRRFFSS